MGTRGVPLKSNFIKHEPCPKCGSRDNLARYSDGSGYCFGCGYKERRTHLPEAVPTQKKYFHLVDKLPQRNVEWLRKYDLTDDEISIFKYSPELDRHVFTDGMYYEMRDVTNKKRKSLSFGEKPLVIFGNHGGTIVLVEDIVSAIKVSRVTDAQPLFGSYIESDRLQSLFKAYRSLVIWLDRDKYAQALKFARTASFIGFKVKVVSTPKDPKECSMEEIRKQLL